MIACRGEVAVSMVAGGEDLHSLMHVCEFQPSDGM